MGCSKASTWWEAKKEWKLTEIFQMHDGTCQCGHHPITDHCVVTNHSTGFEAEVGNCCVKRFMDINISKVFAALKRINKHDAPNGARVNYETLCQAYRERVITAEEGKRYKNLIRRRKLSDESLEFVLDMNDKLLQHFRRSKLPPTLDPEDQPA